MIDWDALAGRVVRLDRRARPGAVLSLAVPLPLPALPRGLPEQGDWFHWQRPDAGLWLAGTGVALRVETAGAGRFAALGAAARGLRDKWRWLDEQAGGMPPTAPVAFVGFAFAPGGEGPLPNACLTVPALLLRAEQGRATATFSCVAGEAMDALARWRNLWDDFADSAPVPAACAPARVPRLVRQPSCLGDAAFLARGTAALSAIGAGTLQKLVLTRSIRLRAEHPVAARPVLQALAGRHPGCAIWGVGRGGKVFLGASPERLLAIRGALTETDALAGTAWMGISDEAPPSLSLGCDKNRREHELVADAIVAALAPLCSELAIPASPEILRLRDLRHWRRRIVGRRKAGIEAFDLLARLHPTPAVGGAPTPEALAWLASHGERREAWYTGGVGWLAATGDADFAVALRCGLIAGRDVSLYAGAGFVAGSDPRQELAETEVKLSPMLAALHASSAAASAPQTRAACR